MIKTRPGRRFILPDGYSLALEPAGSSHAYMFTRPYFKSPKYATPDEAARAAWGDAGLSPPARISEPV